MRIDPLLASLVDKIIRQVGDAAEEARKERFAAPIDAWRNRDVIDFIDHLRQVTRDDYMGLASAPCAPGAANFLIELGTRCAVLREAVEMDMRVMAMFTTAFRFDLTEDGGRAILSIHHVGGRPQVNAILGTWAVISWHKLLQWLIDTEIPLERVEFEHELDGAFADYAAMFCGDCQFNGSANRLVFPASYLDRRIVRLPHEGDRLKATTPGYFAAPGLIATSWKTLVGNALKGQLAKGQAPASMENLAREFGMSGETLRRRLRAEGASYRALKADARLEMARHMIVDRQMGLGEASIGAGFAEPNALARALRQRHGISSGELRARILGKS